MLKRIQKKIQKKEKEAELGLDDDTKEILGFNDTDSDESDSSGFDSDDDAESDDLEFSKSLEERIGEDEEDEGQSDAESDSDEDEHAKVTVQEALKDPIYVSSLDAGGGGEWQCVVCPGKIFKGSKMIDAHRESKAHKRRFASFSKLAQSFEPTSNASEVLGALPKGPNPPRQAEDGIFTISKSNRASKREASAQIRKEKRLKQRALAKAKAQTKAAETVKEPPQSESASPQRKRKRIAEPARDSDASPPQKVASTVIRPKRMKSDKKSSRGSKPLNPS
ncbi:hypothetical protein EYR36_008870 [Pleurotus pulmonarius]|nr:hypothetical protein EYR36_008870 [Pleurotus pulmonarius]